MQDNFQQVLPVGIQMYMLYGFVVTHN